MPRKLITIRDVAARVGVSMSTVSHVLNGNDQHVSPATRALVQAAVKELHYRPNAIARSMVKQKTATVGLVLAEVDNPLFMPVVAYVEEVLRPAGYHMVLASAPDVEREIQAIETLRSQQVDGFIFMSLSTCLSNQHLTQLKNDGVPFILINRCIDDDMTDQVIWADCDAGYQATRHLCNLGHRSIGIIGGSITGPAPRRSALERYQGWRQALEECQLTVDPAWNLSGNYSYEGGYQAIKALLARVEQQQTTLPTALFIANDAMAVGALKALQQAGIEVPGKIAVVAIGDPVLASYTIPALTTLAHPIRETGQLAARMLLDRFAGTTVTSAEQFLLHFHLHIRESCGANAI